MGQNLGQIMPNVVKKVKKQAISLGFFHILLGDYTLFKARSSGCKTAIPKWQFMAIIARNANF